MQHHGVLHNYIREAVDCLVLQFIDYTKIFLRHLNAGLTLILLRLNNCGYFGHKREK